MAAALLAARVVLALVFAIAGIAKLADRRDFRRTVADFGVPTRVAGVVALVLPLAELAVSVALVPAASARWGAAGAVLLLSLFTAGMAIDLGRHNRPICRCFGQLRTLPLSWRSLVRNVALAGLAGFVLWQHETTEAPGALSWLGELDRAGAVSIIAGVTLTLVGLQGWLLWQVLRQQGRLLLRIEAIETRLAYPGAPEPADQSVALGPEVGSQAPDFALADVFGETRTLRSLRSVRPAMLVFADPGCASCSALMPEIGRWQQDHASEVTIAVISRGDADPSRVEAERTGVTNLLLEGDDHVAHAYGIPGTPSAVVVDAHGTVASPVAAGPDAIRGLLGLTVAQRVAAGATSPRAMATVTPTVRDRRPVPSPSRP